MDKDKRNEYWDYLISKIFETISKTEDYNEKDFLIIKLCLLSNLNHILESEEKFNDVIDILRERENTKRFM